MKRKIKRFDGEEGSQVFSAAQEEWLTRGGQNPDRTDPYILARMRSAVPNEPKKEVKPEVKSAPAVARSDNFYGTSSEKEIADASFKTPSTEKPKAAPPKTIVRQAAAKTVAIPSVVKPVATPVVEESKNNTEAKAYKESDSFETKVAKLKAKEAKAKDPYSGDDDFSKKVRELKDKAAEEQKRKRKTAPEAPEFQGNAMKKGGTVKRSSASKRGDGIATKGHTRGKYC